MIIFFLLDSNGFKSSNRNPRTSCMPILSRVNVFGKHQLARKCKFSIKSLLYIVLITFERWQTLHFLPFVSSTNERIVEKRSSQYIYCEKKIAHTRARARDKHKYTYELSLSLLYRHNTKCHYVLQY